MCFRHQKKEPQSQEAYDKLISWFSLHKENYQDVCDSLVMFFEANKCYHPEECTTETLDRVARNLEEHKVSVAVPPRPYCFGIARYVRSEYHRCKLNPLLLPEPGPASGKTPEEQKEELNDQEKSEQKRQACMEGCLQKMKPDEHNLFMTYKKQKGQFKKAARTFMALALGISPNALRQRVKRITNKLRKCYHQCLKIA